MVSKSGANASRPPLSGCLHRTDTHAFPRLGRGVKKWCQTDISAKAPYRQLLVIRHIVTPPRTLPRLLLKSSYPGSFSNPLIPTPL